MIGWLPRRMLACLLFACNALPQVAHAQWQASVGDVQIFRTSRESVAVFPRVAPVDKNGALVARDDPALQLKQALENLRRLAGWVGISPAHFVTLTLYVKEHGSGEALDRVARESFSDWDPAMTIVASNELRVAGALVEVEGVALVRRPRAAR